jgi:competence protein ComEC
MRNAETSVRAVQADERHAFSAAEAGAVPAGLMPALPANANDRPESAAARPTSTRQALSHWRDETVTAMRRTPSLLVGQGQAALQEEARFGHGFLWLPVAFGLGAAFWQSLAVDVPTGGMVLALMAALACLAWTGNDRPAVRLGLALLIMALLGVAASILEAHRHDTILLDSPVTTRITGTVEAREIDTRGHWRYVVAVTKTSDPELGRPPAKVRLLSRSAHEPVPIGAVITGVARLAPPSGPALPGGYDFAFNSYFSGIGAFGFFYGAPQAAPAGMVTDRWTETQRSLRRFRDGIAGRIRAVLPGEAGAIAAALTVADRRGISDETVEALRITGLAHILAISGLHMALAAGSMMVTIRALFSLSPVLVERYAVKKIAALAALATATSYLLISGGAVSAQRAFIMLAVMLTAVLLDRPALTLRNVAIAALVILVLQPSAVSSPGFQMSFAATAALIAVYAAWSRRRSQRGQSTASRLAQAVPVLGVLRRGALFVIGLAATSLIAGLATGIFSAHHFHRVSGYGLLANVAAMPLVTFIVMPAGLVALLAMPFGAENLPLTLMGRGIDGVVAVAHRVAELGGDVATGQLAFAHTALMTAGLLVFVFMRTRLRYLGVIALALGATLALRHEPRAPDLLIAEDGLLVALVTRDHMASNRTRPSAFIFDQWADALRRNVHLGPDMQDDPTLADAPAAEGMEAEGTDGEVQAPPGERVVLTAAQRRHFAATVADHGASADPGRFVCQRRDWCVAHFAAGRAVIMVENPAYIGMACDLAAIVVTPRNLTLTQCRSGALLFTARSLRRTGAVAIRTAPMEPAPIPSDTPAPSMVARALPPMAASAAGPLPASSQNATHGRWSEPILRIETALGSVARPWTRHRTYDWRSRRYVDDAAHDTALAKSPARPNDTGE